jgi:uncharacterized damage-inducible protein DinB
MDINTEIMIEYNHWANLKALESIKTLINEYDKPMKIFSHILLSEELWLKRVKNITPKEQKFWEYLSIESCSQLVEKNKNDWDNYLFQKSPEVLEDKISYVNSKGVQYSNSLNEILTHVFYHSAYHRGQVAVLVRQAGGEPALTDFIVYIRE